MTKYVDVTETAKLIRSALKESFPGYRFSVRSERYAGGSSINISWEDGPTRAQVDAVAGVFQGSYFDGSIDYQGSVYHKLDGEKVRFRADFVHFRRDHSPAAITSAIIQAAMEYGTQELPSLEDFEKGRSFSMSPINDGGRPCRDPFWSWQAIIHRTMEEKDSHDQPREEPPAVTPRPSKTLARVEFDGSDDYSHSQASCALADRRGPVC